MIYLYIIKIKKNGKNSPYFVTILNQSLITVLPEIRRFFPLRKKKLIEAQ